VAGALGRGGGGWGGRGGRRLASWWSGFGFFFVNKAAAAFGSAEVIPPWLAAWLPPLLTALAAFTLLFYTEDG